VYEPPAYDVPASFEDHPYAAVETYAEHTEHEATPGETPVIHDIVAPRAHAPGDHDLPP
jgi:hypothetical protein